MTLEVFNLSMEFYTDEVLGESKKLLYNLNMLTYSQNFYHFVLNTSSLHS